MTYANFQFDPFRESGQWALEQKMAQVAREAHGLEWQAMLHDQDGRVQDAEIVLDMSEARWVEYGKLRDELHELEAGW